MNAFEVLVVVWQMYTFRGAVGAQDFDKNLNDAEIAISGRW